MGRCRRRSSSCREPIRCTTSSGGSSSAEPGTAGSSAATCGRFIAMTSCSCWGSTRPVVHAQSGWISEEKLVDEDGVCRQPPGVFRVVVTHTRSYPPPRTGRRHPPRRDALPRWRVRRRHVRALHLAYHDDLRALQVCETLDPVGAGNGDRAPPAAAPTRTTDYREPGPVYGRGAGVERSTSLVRGITGDPLRGSTPAAAAGAVPRTSSRKRRPTRPKRCRRSRPLTGAGRA
jgi:hypothetical protein